MNGDPSRQFTFQTVADGGTRVTVDGTLAIDSWGASGTATSVPITLTAGKHRLVLEYKETATSPNSALALKYQCVDSSNCTGQPTTMTVVPSSMLTPTWNNRTSTVSPSGRVGFFHYDKPWTGESDYTLAYAPLNGGSNAALITSFVYSAAPRRKSCRRGTRRAQSTRAGAYKGRPT